MRKKGTTAACREQLSHDGGGDGGGGGGEKWKEVWKFNIKICSFCHDFDKEPKRWHLSEATGEERTGTAPVQSVRH